MNFVVLYSFRIVFMHINRYKNMNFSFSPANFIKLILFLKNIDYYANKTFFHLLPYFLYFCTIKIHVNKWCFFMFLRHGRHHKQ